jgi:hypothetical protein
MVFASLYIIGEVHQPARSLKLVHLPFWVLAQGGWVPQANRSWGLVYYKTSPPIGGIAMVPLS